MYYRRRMRILSGLLIFLVSCASTPEKVGKSRDHDDAAVRNLIRDVAQEIAAVHRKEVPLEEAAGRLQDRAEQIQANESFVDHPLLGDEMPRFLANLQNALDVEGTEDERIQMLVASCTRCHKMTDCPFQPGGCQQ